MKSNNYNKRKIKTTLTILKSTNDDLRNFEFELPLTQAEKDLLIVTEILYVLFRLW
jgi:hypothetical protein